MLIISNLILVFSRILLKLPLRILSINLDYKFVFVLYSRINIAHVFLFCPFWEIYTVILLIFLAFGGVIPSFTKGIHLPDGIPIFIVPIMYFLELFTVVVRPFTLLFRIFINITLGHFVISILFLSLRASMFFIPLFIFEIGITLLHTYVFCLLLQVYHLH